MKPEILTLTRSQFDQFQTHIIAENLPPNEAVFSALEQVLGLKNVRSWRGEIEIKVEAE